MNRSSSVLLYSAAAACLLLLLVVNDIEAASAKSRTTKTDSVPLILKPKASVSDAVAFCITANEALREQKNIIGLASWAQSSNITAENDQAYVRTLWTNTPVFPS